MCYSSIPLLYSFLVETQFNAAQQISDKIRCNVALYASRCSTPNKMPQSRLRHINIPLFSCILPTDSVPLSSVLNRQISTIKPLNRYLVDPLTATINDLFE